MTSDKSRYVRDDESALAGMLRSLYDIRKGVADISERLGGHYQLLQDIFAEVNRENGLDWEHPYDPDAEF